MRVIVRLTKRPGQNDRTAVLLLFDQRTRVIVVATKQSRVRRTLHPIPQPSNCAKRTANNSSNEHEWFNDIARARGESREERGGGDVARNSHRHYYIATRTSLVNGRRAAASCRSADRAKRVSNDHSFSFSPLPYSPFFFETTEFIALHFTRPSFTRLSTSLAHSSLIMNGLFIVVAAHVRHFLRFHCISHLHAC